MALLRRPCLGTKWCLAICEVPAVTHCGVSSVYARDSDIPTCCRKEKCRVIVEWKNSAIYLLGCLLDSDRSFSRCFIRTFTWCNCVKLTISTVRCVLISSLFYVGIAGTTFYIRIFCAGVFGVIMQYQHNFTSNSPLVFFLNRCFVSRGPVISKPKAEDFSPHQGL